MSFFPQLTALLVWSTLTIFSQPPRSFLVKMSIFLFMCVRVSVCVRVLKCFRLDCLLLLFSAVATVMWGYFGNPPHLPHPFSCGDAGCPRLGQTLPDGRVKLPRTGQTVRRIARHSQKGSGMSHLRSLLPCNTLMLGAISSMT